MKIGILVWDLSISGGTQRQALEISRELQSRGHQVKLYTAYLNREDCYPALVSDLDIYALDESSAVGESSPEHRSRPLRYLLKLKMYYTIYSLMDNDFDLVNCHGHGVYRIAALYKQLTGVPVVWMMNDLPDIKFPLERKAIQTIDRVVVLDKRNEQLAKDQLSVDATVIRSGLDIEGFDFDSSVEISEDEPLHLLAVSIFLPHRRYEDLVKALAMVRNSGYDANLTIVGSEERAPEYAQEIRQLVREYNLSERVSFVGRVSEEDLRTIYSTHDIFVFPNAPQTWGLAVFEAMAVGTPVIATDGCGASEVLTDHENALITPARSPEDIADAIIELREDDALRRTICHNARDFVENNITWNQYTDGMLEVFQSVSG